MQTAVVLADTSVWIDHLRRGNARLAALLDESLVVMHPFVRGELACGSLKARKELLAYLEALAVPVVALDEEVFQLLERKRIWGQGIGWVDAHLAASTLLTKGCALWTRDGPLRKVAGKAAIPIFEESAASQMQAVEAK